MRASKQLNCCDIFKETLGDAEIDCFRCRKPTWHALVRAIHELYVPYGFCW